MIDFSEQAAALKKKFQPDWYRAEGYQSEMAALWGYTLPHPDVNGFGVIVQHWETVTVKSELNYHYAINAVQTPNGLWTYGYDYHTGTAGGGSAPMVTDTLGFESLEELTGTVFAKKIVQLKEEVNKDHTDPKHRASLNKLVTALYDALTPQLEML